MSSEGSSGVTRDTVPDRCSPAAEQYEIEAQVHPICQSLASVNTEL